ncbi:hypothetical protein SLA2020_199320 [Shorea laevis]
MSLSTVIVMALVLIFAGYATADFDRQCYKDCLRKFCQVPESPEPCIDLCIRNCVPHSPTNATVVYYCNVGCSLDQCTQFGNEVMKVGSCVDDCFSNFCNKHF